MKNLIFTMLALVAAPALAIDPMFTVTEVDLTQLPSGSSVARAVVEVRENNLAELAARQSVQRCRLPASVFQGNPGAANPANLDGTCVSLNSCASVSGTQAFTGATGCSGGVCCIKRDCAGSGTNSACVFPDLAGDTLAPGQAGRFVSGSCPTGLSCFLLTRT